MVRLIVIAALCATIVDVLWFLIFTRYNRRKGALVLRWVEAACSSRGRLLQSQWLGRSCLQAHLSFASHWFENARVTVRLLPRPLLVQWLLCLWKRQRETVTFEADLDDSPGFNLEISRHRWLTQKPKEISERTRNWTISRPGPVVLTTRTEWADELTPLVNTLMTSRGHNLLTVRFRRESPNLTATIPLDALSGEETTASFLSVLRDLAAGSSASRH
ncbi:MAG TPA: hypothetical protein VFM77_04235 [Terriglobales bacterium]|nr:hypothetical protein [Terriglobales bacterium]